MPWLYQDEMLNEELLLRNEELWNVVFHSFFSFEIVSATTQHYKFVTRNSSLNNVSSQ